MPDKRPLALCIAGLDPSAGAGLLADVKTLEMNGVYGLCVCSALTLQNDVSFERVHWVPMAEIREQVRILFARFKVDYVKIGLVESLPQLLELVGWLKVQNPRLQIVWDPVLKASAGYDSQRKTDRDLLQALCAEMALVTPSKPEMLRMWPHEAEADVAAQVVSSFCPVLLKGGHDEGAQAIDVLFKGGKWHSFTAPRLPHGEKHGSGYVLASAVLANLAKGKPLVEACRAAKDYTTAFLASNDSLLGYHSKS